MMPSDPSRPVNLKHALQQMAAESRGSHGSGLLAFQIFGAGHGNELFFAAEMGNPTARRIVQAAMEFVSDTGSAPPDAVQCLLCSGPFTVPAELPWAIFAVHAAVPEPTVICCSGLCARCCAAMDWDELCQRTMARYRHLFPSLEVLPPIAEPGHA